MTTLADPKTSRAVLIGSYQYRSLEDLAGVANNLAAFRRALTDPSLWGLSPNHCAVITHPTHAPDVIDALHEAGREATDTLLFYFSGHGLVDHTNDDELYLAIPSSDPSRVDRTSVPWSWVRREMHESDALRKVAILDCCYSGRALGKWMGDDADITDLLEVEGTCILTATARTRRALAPPDAQYTAFTGELIAALTEGIPDGPELLDMDSIYKRVKSRMRAKDLPIPQQSQLDRGGNIALVHNKAFRPKPVAPPPPPELEPEPAQPAPPKPMPVTPAEPVLPRPDLLRPRREWQRITGLSSPGVTTAWRERLRPADTLSITRPAKPARRKYQGAAIAAATLTAVWLGLLLGVDRYTGLDVPLTGALVTGLLAFASAPFAGRQWHPGFVAIALVVFELFAILQSVFAPNWLARSMAIAMAAVFFFTFGSLVIIEDDLQRFHADVDEWRVAGAAVDMAQAQRWLTPSPHEAVSLTLTHQITEIPSVRFAEVGEPFAFLAVAGVRVLLVSFARWPSGHYTRRTIAPREVLRDGAPAPQIADEVNRLSASLGEWRTALRGRRGDLHAILVIDPADSGEGCRVGPDVTEGTGILVTTRAQFADLAGEFLIGNQHKLDAAVLARIRMRLESGGAVSSRR